MSGSEADAVSLWTVVLKRWVHSSHLKQIAGPAPESLMQELRVKHENLRHRDSPGGTDAAGPRATLCGHCHRRCA